jgi:hypothetical protein
MGNEVEGNYWGLILNNVLTFAERTEENHGKSVTMVGVPTQIQTVYLHNPSEPLEPSWSVSILVVTASFSLGYAFKFA